MDSVTLEMPINAVDQYDNPVGVVQRRDAFDLAVNFRVVHVLVFNSRGELLLQQLANSRERNPMYWGSSVAGYVFASENYLHAATRRLKQELGVETSALHYVGKTGMRDQGCLKFISVFTAVLDGPFSVDTAQIEEIRFESLDRIQQLIASGPILFTPTFLHVLRFYEEATRAAQ